MTLTDLRIAITDAITGEAWTTYSHVPERIHTPAAMVTPADPYLESGPTFGRFTAQYHVTLVADTATNEVTTTALDTMIEDALVALANAGLTPTTVSEPYMLTLTEALHLAADLTITETITL